MLTILEESSESNSKGSTSTAASYSITPCALAVNSSWLAMMAPFEMGRPTPSVLLGKPGMSTVAGAAYEANASAAVANAGGDLVGP